MLLFRRRVATSSLHIPNPRKILKKPLSNIYSQVSFISTFPIYSPPDLSLPKVTLPEDSDTTSTLLFMLNKLKMDQHITQLASEIQKKNLPCNSFDCEIFIKTYAGLGDQLGALTMYEKMKASQIPLTIESYNTLIKLIPDQASMFYEGIKKDCLPIETTTMAALLAAGISEHDTPHAVLEDIRNGKVPATLEIYNALIKRYGQQEETALGFSLLEQMRQNSISPSTESYNYILKHLSNMKKKTNPSKQILVVSSFFSGMQRDGVKPNYESFETLIGYFIFLGGTKQIIDILDLMLKRNIIPKENLYNDIFQHLLSKDQSVSSATPRRLAKIERFHEQMKAVGLFPPLFIYTKLVTLFGTSERRDYVDKIVAEVALRKLPKDEVFYSALLHIYGWHSYRKALEIWNEMNQNTSIQISVNGYTTFLNVCGRQEEFEKGLEVFAEMQKKGLQMTLYTYRALLNLYRRKGNSTEKIQFYFDEMVEQGLTPTIDMFVILLTAHNAVDNHSKVDQIVELLEKTHPHNLVSLHACCNIYGSRGDIDRALHFFGLWKALNPTSLSLFKSMIVHLAKYQPQDLERFQTEFTEMKNKVIAKTEGFDRSQQ